jgi:deoxyribose-phosphate aldolase
MSPTRVQPASFRVPPADAVALETRAAELATRSLKGEAKRTGLQLAVRMTDLTTLEGRDSPGKVSALCRKAIRPHHGRPDVPSVAAVCVYPDLVRTATRALAGSTVAVASVATAFPAGRTALRQKLAETRWAVAEGASEIDMVIDRGAFLIGRYGEVFDQICRVKEACGAARLKVILETGELATYDNMRKASRIAVLAGADFIKTSTGKVTPAATPPVALLMLEVVRDFYLETGTAVGVKVAGGIRTAKEALRYLVLVNETAGDQWLSPERFRFGASTLLNDLLMQLVRLDDGHYQRPQDFGGD